MPNRFWAFEEGGSPGQPNTLRLEGPIAEESWWGDEVTPAQFRADLAAHPGDLTVYINSPGGDVVAGSLIYSMLREHNGKITVRIDGLAASAASVVAMAGDRVEMAPTAYMMIHNAATIALGNKADMQAAADMLAEVDRGIRTAYALKTGKSERELAKMMDAETWMSAPKALEDGFCDAICYADAAPAAPADPDAAAAAAAATTAAQAVANGILTAHSHALPSHTHSIATTHTTPPGVVQRGFSMPAVAYSPRRQQQITAQAAAQRAAAQAPTTTNQANADAARARLRLLSI